MNKTKNLLSLYFPAFLIPVIIMGALFTLYQSGNGYMYPYSVSLYNVFFSGIASLSFMTYLRKSTRLQELTNTWAILTALSYGLCSHAVLPTTDYGSQFIYALLPCLFIGFEAFVFEHKSKCFVLLLSLCLLTSPITTTSIMIGLIIIFFFETKAKKAEIIGDFLQLLFIFALSICISGAVSIPAYKEHFSLAASQTYGGFSLTQPFFNFISRFLPGAIPTTFYSATRNINLYFGLFSFLLFILYFFQNEITLKERIKTLALSIILLFSTELSPLSFIFELGTENRNAFIFYEILFLFYAIKNAAFVLPKLQNYKKINLIAGLFSALLILVLGYCGSHTNFHQTAIISAVIFTCLYLICILLLHFNIPSNTIPLLTITFVMVELLCNCFLITNQNIYSLSATSSNNYIWKQEAHSSSLLTDNTSSSDATGSNTLSTAYENYVQEHMDTELLRLVSTLTSQLSLEENELLAENKYGLLNHFEYTSALCNKIGCSGDLFVDADLEFVFPDSSLYQITSYGGGIYNLYQYSETESLETIYIPLEFIPSADGTIILYDNFSSYTYRFDSCQAGETYKAYISVPAAHNSSLNFQLLGYYLNEDLYTQIPALYTTYLSLQTPAHGYMYVYYAGIALTCIGVLILFIIYFNRDNQKILQILTRFKQHFSTLAVWSKIHKHICSNYVYYLAFCIPVIIYLFSMIIFSCTPFGPNSFFDQDGIGLSLPSILSSYHDIQNGNTLYSMNGGYGYSPYALCTTFLLRGIFTLFPVNFVPGLILLLLGIAYGLSAFTMTYYLTHRLSGTKAHKKDYRLLIPALIYSINAYMLAYHCFPGWFFVYLMFPLLLLAMDYLMHTKNWFFYTLMLALCMFSNLYLAFYICIFLVIHFFSYHISGIKDFFRKGIRFAFTSILAAGCNIFTIIEMISTKNNSLYQNADSVFPSPALHSSFFEQWKQLFVFAPSATVTVNDGFINEYMGIFTLLLLGIFLLSDKYTLKEKICRCIPIAILTISFNGEVLSYIWNGFHYQSKVPNRYVFLLMFLVATMAYDALLALKRVSFRRFLALSVMLIFFIIACQIWGENTLLAFISTLVLIMIYVLGYLLYKKTVCHKQFYYKLAILVMIIEMGTNMLYTTANYSLNAILAIGSIEQTTEFVNTRLDTDSSAGRISSPGNYYSNFGLFYDIPTGSFFNSYVTSYQSRLHQTYGFNPGANFTSYDYNSTPFGLAVSGHKYIFLPIYAKSTVTDLTEYNYIGACGNYYIFENPNVLSLGIYAPAQILNIPSNIMPPLFHNVLCSLYTAGNDSLYDIYLLPHSMNGTTTNTFSFLNNERKIITLEESQNLIEKISSNSENTEKLYLRLRVTSSTSGQSYLYHDRFVPLGYITSNTPTVIESLYSQSQNLVGSECLYITLNKQVFNDFMQEAAKNQMENVHIDNNIITGTTNYKNDGFTMLSIPYDPGWHAYVDDIETEILCPYDSFMLFETPAGTHDIKLVYERTGMKLGISISVGCAFFTILLYLYTIWIHRHKKKL